MFRCGVVCGLAAFVAPGLAGDWVNFIAGHACIASQRAEGWIPLHYDYDEPASPRQL